MGRPPFGERAMTAAEKQRRYRERRAAKFGNHGAVTKSTAKTVKRLEARVRELEAEFARLSTATGGLPARVTPQWTATLYDLLAAYAEVAMARAERPSEAEYAHVVAELEREREQHEATLKEFGRKFKQLSAKFQKLQKLEAELERERKRREGAENKLPKPRRCRRKVRI